MAGKKEIFEQYLKDNKLDLFVQQLILDLHDQYENKDELGLNPRNIKE